MEDIWRIFKKLKIVLLYFFIFCSLNLRLANRTNFLHGDLNRVSVGLMRTFKIYITPIFKAIYVEWSDVHYVLTIHADGWKQCSRKKRISWTTLAKLGGKLVVTSLGRWEYITLSSQPAAELMPLKDFFQYILWDLFKGRKFCDSPFNRF